MADKDTTPAYDPLDWIGMADERCSAPRLGDRRVLWSPAVAAGRRKGEG